MVDKAHFAASPPVPPPEALYVETEKLATATTQRGNRCTKPSHSKSLANFVANFQWQRISAARTK